MKNATKRKKKATYLEGETRPPFARMFKIFQKLKFKKMPSLKVMGAELEVTPKTVQRDVEFMRDQLLLPIDYDWSKKRYYFTEHVEHFPGLEISTADVPMLWAIGKALEMFPGATLHGILKSIYDEYMAQLDEKGKEDFAEMDERFWCEPFGAPMVNIEAFEVVATGVRELREVEFEYRKQGEKEYRLRRLQGYQMRRADGQWYLVGLDVDAQKERRYHIGRMRNAKLLKRRYKIPADFKERYARSLGISTGDKVYDISLRLNAKMADIQRDRPFHKSQTWEDLEDGGARLTMKLDSLEEIEFRVLSWGKNVIIEGPVELIDRVRAVGRFYREQYGDEQVAGSVELGAQGNVQPTSNIQQPMTIAASAEA